MRRPTTAVSRLPKAADFKPSSEGNVVESPPSPHPCLFTPSPKAGAVLLVPVRVPVLFFLHYLPLVARPPHPLYVFMCTPAMFFRLFLSVHACMRVCVCGGSGASSLSLRCDCLSTSMRMRETRRLVVVGAGEVLLLCSIAYL